MSDAKPTSLVAMATRWRSEADRFRAYKEENTANVMDSCATELEQWIATGMQYHQDDRMLDDVAHGEVMPDVFGTLLALNRVQLAEVTG
jgi:hypothetical protein